MYPEDRVLVGVINRRRDLIYARDEHWYRVPFARMKRGIDAEYIAFFLSRAFKEHNGSICYYAERRGVELAYRRDLIPSEPDHPRANDVYYRIALGPLQEKLPPARNTNRHVISFIHTTWDRFCSARSISELYGPPEQK